MQELVVLIPCYNEAATIGKVVADFRSALPEAVIYVYDNNSTDDTAKIATEAGAIVRREYRQGKGNVIRAMFRDIDAKCYIMVDGDDTYPAEDAAKMAKEVLENGADMVIGDRLSSTYFQENKRAFHGAGNIVVRKSINTLWRPKEKIVDVMTGYRAFSPLFVKSFPVLSKGFEIETEMTIHALDHNLLVRSLPVGYRDRPEGSESKLNTFSDGIKVLLTIFNLYRNYKPLQFFGIIALILAVISLIMFVPVLGEFISTGFVERFPTLIVSTMLGVMAMLSFVCGLVLDTHAQNARKDYEVKLNIIQMLLK